jgi:tRNA threonylcarbamoyladenosine biosynthesis protein TsaB
VIILGIDTSSADLGVSVIKNGSPLSSVCRYVRNSHAEHITQAVKTALSMAGVNISEVKHIAVSIGPGSFTGLRIGLSFVKGLSLCCEVKVIPLSSLMVLAHAAGSHYKGKIFTALDARQGRIHWGFFDCDYGEISRIGDDCLSSPEELLSLLKPDDLLVTDTMGYSRSIVFHQFNNKARIVDVQKTALQRGLSCATIGFNNIDNEPLWLCGSEIVPNYLQMSAAQEKLCV